MASQGSIGVFDSGVGGLTVAAALRRRLPRRPIVYLGDTARLPYGTKSAQTVRRYTQRNVQFLLELGIDWSKLIHASQAVELLNPLPSAARVLADAAAVFAVSLLGLLWLLRGS